MDRKAYLIGAIALACFSPPALADTFEVSPDRPNYSAEFNKPPAEVAALIAAQCMDRDWPVTEMSDNRVQCGGYHPNSVSILYRSGGEILRFVIIPANGGSRVQGSSLVSRSNGFGVVTFGQGMLGSSVAVMLADTGGKFTDGTRFVGPDFGFRTVNTVNRVKVFAVAPGSPAAQAGLQPGDEIQKIGKKWIWGGWDIPKAIKRIAPGQPIEMTVKRGREEVKIAFTEAPK